MTTIESKYYCHDITEIVPNLLLSGMQDVPAMIDAGVEMLVSLLEYPIQLPEAYRGELRRFGIPDGETLPQAELEKCVDEIIQGLNNETKIGLFCCGGHGRTGFIAACVLGKLGFEDPIRTLRDNYCSYAVESYGQIMAIAQFLGNPVLADRYKYTVSPYKGRVSDK